MLNCNIVKDLLPAYIDGLCSAETAAEVADHLVSCEQCRHIAERMKTPISQPQPKERNINPLRKVKRRTWIIVGSTIVAAALCVAAFVFISTMHVPLNSNEVTLSQTAQMVKPIDAQPTQGYTSTEYQVVTIELEDGTVSEVVLDIDRSYDIFIAASNEAPEDILYWRLSMTSLVKGMNLSYYGSYEVIDGKGYYIIEPKKRMFEVTTDDGYDTINGDIVLWDNQTETEAVIIRFADEDIIVTMDEIRAMAGK